MFKESSLSKNKIKNPEKPKVENEEEIIEPGSAEDLEKEIDAIFEGISREEIEKTTEEVRKKTKEEFKEAGKSDKGPDFEAAVFTRVALEMEKKKESEMGDQEKNKGIEDVKIRKDYVANLISKNPANAELLITQTFLPAIMKWTERREASGKDVSFLEFIKEEDISKLELDIIINEFEKYNGPKTENILKETARRKLVICDSIRTQAQVILSEIGHIEPSISSAKHAKLERDFEVWMKRFAERSEIIIVNVMTGFTALLRPYIKYWNGQGKIDHQMAKINKKKIGEMEHVYMLKTISQMIERLVNLMDKSSNAKEIQFYNDEIKNYYHVLTEWNNEFKRLYAGVGFIMSNEKVKSAYEKISREVKKLDKVLLNEKYDAKETKNKSGTNELIVEENTEKKAICSSKLKEIREQLIVIDNHSYPEEDYKKIRELERIGSVSTSEFKYDYKKNVMWYFESGKSELDKKNKLILQETIDLLIKIEKSIDIKEITAFVSDLKHKVISNRIDISTDEFNDFIDKVS